MEFVFSTDHDCDHVFLNKFFSHFRTDWNKEQICLAINNAEVYNGEDALRHIFRVASSLDSLIVGEREIISQVRKAYERCRNDGLTGDFLRLIIKCTISTAKQVYTQTKIANNPVSIVSLAERELRTRNPSPAARIIIIGAGVTNTNLSKYLVKHGFTNFVIFNRTLANAKKLAKYLATDKISAKAFSLDQLEKFKNGFDILITCTSSPEKIISKDVYSSLLRDERDSKIIIDLSVPSNIDEAVFENNNVDVIDISKLLFVAEKNMMERQKEVIAAEEIIDENIDRYREMHRTRRIEIKMKDVPEKIRQIKEKALNDIFAEEIRSLDDHSREVLVKVLDYMEKKCVSVPMILAKEIILVNNN